jgi:PTS system N-acetylglucosamine-specific IIC component
VVHAILTGTALLVTNALGIHEGFTFSAGFTDWGLNFFGHFAQKPWLIIPVGLVYAVIYYVVFRFMIVKFNLKTPGREPEGEEANSMLSLIIDQPMGREARVPAQVTAGDAETETAPTAAAGEAAPEEETGSKTSA